VTRGLAAIHSVGIIHRDLKPANILIGPDGLARIADLGIARQVEESRTVGTTTGHVPGTYEYMAPEQISNPRGVDGRVDLFSMGVTFYELLAGSRPVGAWHPASTVNPTVPRAFDEILSRLLAPRPDHRHADVYEVLAAIGGLPGKKGQPPEHAIEKEPRERVNPLLFTDLVKKVFVLIGQKPVPAEVPIAIAVPDQANSSPAVVSITPVPDLTRLELRKAVDSIFQGAGLLAGGFLGLGFLGLLVELLGAETKRSQIFARGIIHGTGVILYDAVFPTALIGGLMGLLSWTIWFGEFPYRPRIKFVRECLIGLAILGAIVGCASAIRCGSDSTVSIGFGGLIGASLAATGFVIYQWLQLRKPKNLARRADHYRSRGYLDVSIIYMTQAIRRDPHDPGWYRERCRLNRKFAEIYRRPGSEDQQAHGERSLIDINEAIPLAPSDPSSYFERGQCYVGFDHLDEALADFETALSLDPRNPETYRALIEAVQASRASDAETPRREIRRVIEPEEPNSIFAGPPWSPWLVGIVMMLAGPAWGGVMTAWNWWRLGQPGQAWRSLAIGAAIASIEFLIVRAAPGYVLTLSFLVLIQIISVGLVAWSDLTAQLQVYKAPAEVGRTPDDTWKRALMIGFTMICLTLGLVVMRDDRRLENLYAEGKAANDWRAFDVAIDRFTRYIRYDKSSANTYYARAWAHRQKGHYFARSDSLRSVATRSCEGGFRSSDQP
jgi:Protein kinase domain/Tetratricopeptide repeat